MGRGVDRISEMPDTIRLHILSLLPRKYAIRTGALSWRWRDLWKYRWPHAATLIFGREFGSGLSKEEFASSVDRILKLRGNKKVEIFHLFFNPGSEYSSNAVRWIEYAISNQVEELCLDFFQESGKRFKMPDSLLHGESLTHLHLSFCEFGSPDFSRLKYLETATLKDVNITDLMISDLIANCPCLERLTLRQCPQLISIKVSDTYSRLKKLVIVDCENADELKIIAPNLCSFRFAGQFLKKYRFRRVPSLSDVLMNSLGHQPGKCQTNWVRIIKDLADVKVVTLCSRAIQQIAIVKQPTNFVLENLQELQILMDLMAETNLSDVITFFSKCRCPKVEKIFMELPTGTKDPSLEVFLEISSDDSPLECDFSGLRVVKMNNFKGHKNEMELARFFLERATKLESIILVTPQVKDATFSSDFSIFLQLKFLKEVSDKVKIVVCTNSQDSSGLLPTHPNVYCKVRIGDQFC